MKILIAESEAFSPRALELLRSKHSVTCGSYDRDSLIRALAGIEVLWVRLRFHVDSIILDHAPQLRVLISNTTGLNHIDLELLQRRDIRLLSLKGETAFLKDIRATAEHTMALTLALLRHVPLAAQDVSGGRWQRDLFRGRELFGKTFGIIGLGRLGRIVARYALAFDMRVVACDPFVIPSSAGEGVELLPFDHLLEISDIISVHASLTQNSGCLIGKEAFLRMKPHAWLINTARGELIDEGELLAVLRSGKLAGAALDVLSHEQDMSPEEHPLIHYAKTHTNLLITPHIGGCTVESFEKTEMYLAEKFMRIAEEQYRNS